MWTLLGHKYSVKSDAAGNKLLACNNNDGKCNYKIVIKQPVNPLGVQYVSESAISYAIMHSKENHSTAKLNSPPKGCRQTESRRSSTLDFDVSRNRVPSVSQNSSVTTSQQAVGSYPGNDYSDLSIDRSQPKLPVNRNQLAPSATGDHCGHGLPVPVILRGSEGEYKFRVKINNTP